MICIRDFTGIIGGKAVAFTAGDKISATDAKELDLANKPDLAQKEAPVVAKTEGA